MNLLKQVSFIIPHKGREEFLVQTVESILAQDLSTAEINIYIITQNEQLSLLSPLIEQHDNIHVNIQTGGKTISALRNLGAAMSSSEYLAFLDADVSLSPNWTETMLATLHAVPDRALVSAAQINGENAPPLERIRTALSNVELDCNVSFLPGRNLFLSRESFEKVNGFPEHLITCEDYYFTDQVNQFGRLYYTSQATYVHIGEDKVYRDMYKKEIWRGQSNLQSIKGRNVPLREIPSFVVPIAIAALLLIFIVSTLLNLPYIAITSIVLALIPFIIYTLRLYKLTKSTVPLKYSIKFYLLYFPARAIGTLGGLFKSFSNINSK